MTDLFGAYRSQTTRALQRIDSTKYPDTNKDFEKNIQRLNEFTDYMAQYMTQMQKGIDQANQDPISKLRDTITNLGILLGGGELLYGINLGDLQYFLPAIGAMFGFDGEQPFPLNLLYAAEHFFLGYIIPLDSWGFAVIDVIDQWAIAFGIPADFVASLHDLINALQGITSDYVDLFNALANVLTIFDISPILGDLGLPNDLWGAVRVLFGGYDLASLGDTSIVGAPFHALAPWIEIIATLLNDFSLVIKGFTAGTYNITGILNLASLFTNFINLLPGGTFNIGSAWVTLFQGALTAPGLPTFDASKIVTGILGAARIPTITAAMTSGIAAIDTLVQAWGGAGTGHTLADLTAQAQAIVPASVIGNLGGANIGATTQNIVDAWLQSVAGGTAVGNSIAQAQSVLSAAISFLGWTPAGIATPPTSVAAIASNTDASLKARAIQKPPSANIDPTLDATFNFNEVWQTNPLPIIATTSGVTVMGDITVRDGGNKLAVTWYGYPTGGTFASISDFRVNIYTVNKTTLVRTRIHASANIVASVGTGTVPQFNSYNLSSAIPCAAGDMLTAELAILGAGTYNLVGQVLSPQVLIHPTYGLHAMTRTSAAAPATMNPPGVGGSPASYSRNIPLLGLSGVAAQTTFSPVLIPFPASGTFDPTLYAWANYFDRITCGAGGGGSGGNATPSGGTIGVAGSWSQDTLTKAQAGSSLWTITAGGGGAGGLAYGNGGGAGGTSIIATPGQTTLTGAGGAGAGAGTISASGYGQSPGQSPGNFTYTDHNGQSVTIPGGAGGGFSGTSGSQPGGSGAGGNSSFVGGGGTTGGNGAPGECFIRCYQ